MKKNLLRYGFRTLFGLGAVVILVGGFLGQAHTTEVSAAAIPSARELAELTAVGDGLASEAPSPRYSFARRVFSRISLNPDDQNLTGDLIEVSIPTQRVTAWHNGKIVYRFKISTARPGYHTPIGHFHVLDKASNWYSNQWQVWMPDALRFHDSYFIHALPYRTDPSARIGESDLGFARSHGCVRVGVADQHLLWTWAYVGIPVWVHD
ncbi:MAG: L,D-transpeptidase [Actinomycetota bacterium]